MNKLTSEQVKDSAFTPAGQGSPIPALPRWARGDSYVYRQVMAALQPSCQARWYARANDDFRSWVENGGFSQDEQTAPPADDARAAQASAPTPHAMACIA